MTKIMAFPPSKTLRHYRGSPLTEGKKALLAMELHDYWYSYAERRRGADSQRWISTSKYVTSFAGMMVRKVVSALNNSMFA